ncbi:polymorphic toxin-type HINT domain-containing protein [Risungbinella massiliensis]|uniref:polymorphic toxin-type HINT domain-containing protein n=1 Tax=Risungbinella massiliensis TaxID=1329796 RepID=UPI0005CBC052|nr:polymorphic toxin-type HINT domain-containing protein [Risungbinella massiliensis]
MLHFYDELNRETAFTDGTGDVNRIVEKSYYDAVDKEVKTVIGEEDVKEFAYDKDDEPIYTKENSNPIVETWALHDGAGNLAVSVDKQGSTYQIYDLNENLLESRDEEGKTTMSTYNTVGDKTKQVDPNGTVTTWEYDEEGQLKKETVTLTPSGAPEPKLQIQEYGYNDIGLLITKDVKEQTGVNIVTTKQGTISYDELGRVVQEVWMSEGGKKTEINRLYDNNGNEEKSWLYDQTTPVDPLKDTDGDGYLNSETTSEYDANNRLMKQTVTHSGTSTIHNYKDKDDVETIQTALGSTKVTRNKDDLVSAVQIPNYDGATITYDYNLNENIRTIRAPGVVTDFTYNGGSKVATMKGRNNAGALVVDLAYTYTDTEQISQITNAGVVKGKYTYTTNGFLKTVEANGKTLQYTHDGMGNILKTENLTTGKVKDEFTYIGDNRISERKEYDDTNGNLLGTTSFTFNESGNLSQSIRTEAGTNKKTEQNFTYNNEDQLVSLTKLENGTTTKKVAYEYDQEGNRLVETVDDRIRYEYQRDSKDEIFGIVKWVDEVEESRTYFFKDGDGKLLGLRHNDIEYYYQFNARGDVIALTDPAGNVVVTYDYDEWGNITQITGDQTLANANPYRYVGRYGVFYDGETGLYHMGWRDYDPTTGRFIVADTYEGEEDSAVTQNRYLYAEGDPVNNIDPDGNWGSWLQKGWKGIKKAAKTVYNVAIGDSIKTLKNPNSRWYEKVFAAVDIASNFIPGAKLITSGVKAIKAGVKAYKTYKKIKKIAKKIPAQSLMRMRKAKLSVQKSRTVVKGTKKVSKVPKRSKKPKASANRNQTKSTNKTKPKQKIECKCFTINTKVLTDKGQKNIQDIKIGDKVLAKDEKTGKQAYKAVQWLYERKVKEVYKLYIGKEVIETTDEHPFWIKGKGWIQVKDLKSGDQVEDDEGNLLVVWKIEREKKETTVYNFSVEDYHTFYVSDLKVFTHNCGGKVETFYRAMSEKEYKKLVKNQGRLTKREDGASMLKITKDVDYVMNDLSIRKKQGKKYERVIEFTVAEGTYEKLKRLGRAHNSVYDQFPNMARSGDDLVEFQVERGGSISYGLGSSVRGLMLFNLSIRGVKVLR